MTLLSTLSAAAEVRQASLERRAGHDPSTQEAAGFVRHYLLQALPELEELLMRLRLVQAYVRYREEAQPVALLRRFDALMTLRRTTRLLEVVHQRLLSLYPDVAEDLVEEARSLTEAARQGASLDAETFPDYLHTLLGRGLAFTGALRQVL